MLEILPESSGNVVGFKVIGKLEADDFKDLKPRVEDVIEEWGSVRLVMHLDEMDSASPGGIWEDLKMGAKHFHETTRIAVIGDDRWQKWIAALSNPPVRGQVRHFRTAQLREAWDWVRKSAPGAEGKAAAQG